jgi:hypothetical protein
MLARFDSLAGLPRACLKAESVVGLAALERRWSVGLLFATSRSCSSSATGAGVVMPR